MGLRRKKRGLDGLGNTLLTVMTNKAPAVLIQTEHFQPQQLKELMNAPVIKSLPSCNFHGLKVSNMEKGRSSLH